MLFAAYTVKVSQGAEILPCVQVSDLGDCFMKLAENKRFMVKNKGLYSRHTKQLELHVMPVLMPPKSRQVSLSRHLAMLQEGNTD